MTFDVNRKRKNANSKDDGLLPVPSLLSLNNTRNEIPSILNADFNPMPNDGLLGSPMMHSGYQINESLAERLFLSQMGDGPSKFMPENDRNQSKLNPRKILIELYSHFLNIGWFNTYSGTVTMKMGHNVFYVSKKTLKDRIEPNDINSLDMKDLKADDEPAKKLKKINACPMLHILPHQLRNAHVVIFIPSKNAVMLTLHHPGKDFTIANFEMIKGIRNEHTEKQFENDANLTIPIIENDRNEDVVEASMRQAMTDYQDVPAVLIRRRGFFVWGPYWDKAKSHAESFEYLFDIALQAILSGIDISQPPFNGKTESSEI